MGKVKQMATIKIIDLATKTIATSYEADAPNQGQYGGPWGRPEQTTHMQVPSVRTTEADDVITIVSGEVPDVECIRVYENASGELFLVEDASLIFDKAKMNALSELSMTDAQISRSMEDLYDTLVTSGVVSASMFPQQLQDRVADKKAKRSTYITYV